jgi:saccharopine dehydrogenase-like NADP-dependent oxidoreductase
MKVLLIGVGTVGEAIAAVAATRPWLERMVLADHNLDRAREVSLKLAAPAKFPVEQVDAGDTAQIAALARRHDVDLIMNAVTNAYNHSIFEGAYQAGRTYLDMAMEGEGAGMGAYQFARAGDWEQKGLLAILSIGMDPGASDILAAYAAKHLFDEINEIGVRDVGALKVSGFEFAPTFSRIDTIEECTDPALVWERDKGWFTVPPFSEPEIFDFPEGIGPVECVHVEHEEVVLIPRWIKCRRVTFKYGLDAQFMNAIRVIRLLGMYSPTPVDVKGVRVAPRDVVVACLPDPALLGDRMTGKTCVGTWVSGWKDGRPRQVYLYQSTDNAFSMSRYGCQAVAFQTGACPVIAMDLLVSGAWQGTGVLGPEAFDPDPYLALMPAYDLPYGMVEMDPRERF